MYRIIAVISFCLIYSVQSESAKSTTKSKCHIHAPILKESRNVMNNCFSSVVQTHLNGSVPGKCSNVSEFGESMKSYYRKVRQECKYNSTVSTDKILEFVNYSLLSYKEFYGDIACVERMERNISNCVFATVGFFNITNEKKHSTWSKKIWLTYGGRNCKNAINVKACIFNVLTSCKNTTREYVASLFDFSLKNCNDSSANKTISRPVNAAPSGMSNAVLATVITISVLIGIVL